MRSAVIGIGSNSVRMLLADIEPEGVRRLKRDREGTRLFAGLDADNRLREDVMEFTAATVARMADDARAAGAEELFLFATSAARDAANGDELAALLKRTSGLDVEICSGETEAALSFLGATDGGVCGVIDIGGGSTELVTGSGAELFSACSCQMGAVRLSRMLPCTNTEELQAVVALADQILRDTLAGAPIPAIPEKWFGTGGTFTTLAAMVRGLHWTDRTYMHGTAVSLAQVRGLAEKLAVMTVDERRELPGLQPNRADIIVHGMAILIAVMQHLGIDTLTVSEYGNLDGYLKKHYGKDRILAN